MKNIIQDLVRSFHTAERRRRPSMPQRVTVDSKQISSVLARGNVMIQGKRIATYGDLVGSIEKLAENRERARQREN